MSRDDDDDDEVAEPKGIRYCVEYLMSLALAEPDLHFIYWNTPQRLVYRQRI